MQKKTIRWLLGFVILAIGLAIVFFTYLKPAEPSSAGSPPPMLALRPITIQKSTIEEAIQTTGVLQPYTKLEVGAQVSGQIESIRVKLGDQVKKGDIVATIDPTIAKNELHEKESSQAQQKADLATRQLDLAQAYKEQARQRRLAANDAISRVELEEAELKLKRAAIAVESAQAQAKQLEATVESARAKLQYTQIKAPISGDVINIAAQTGQTLIASQQVPVIMTLGQLDKLMVVAQVPEADIGKIYKDQKVYFTTLSDPHQPIWGKVEAIRPTAKTIKEAIFYEVISSLPNPERKLLIDMTVQITFVLRTLNNVLVIPLSAVGPKDSSERNAVHMLDASGKTVVRMIKIGIDDHIQAQVLEGLKEGEQVINPFVDNTAKEAS
ncbi:MAG: efflux RND transporter periplasmic adaptor subunit [Pseudomonadota bacterium]